jgi:GT2 family glycosyltransferase
MDNSWANDLYDMGKGRESVVGKVDMKKVAILVPAFRADQFFKDLFPVLQVQIEEVARLHRYSVEIVIVVPDHLDLEIYGNALRQKCLRVIRTSEIGFAAPRNLLWNFAKEHDIKIFLDDDQVPKNYWLSNMLAAIENNPGFSVFSGPITHYLASESDQLKSSPLLPKPKKLLSGRIKPRDAYICNSAYIRDMIGCLDSPFSLEFNDGGEDTFFLESLNQLGHNFFMTPDAIVIERWDISRITTKNLIARTNRGIKAYYKLRLAIIENGWKTNSNALVVYGRIFLALILAPLIVVVLVVNLLNPFKIHKVRLNCFMAKIYNVSTIPWIVKWNQLQGRYHADFK